MRKLFYFLFLLGSLSACLKKDTAIVLPPTSGDLTLAQSTLGTSYDVQEYYNIKTGRKVSADSRSFDLCFASKFNAIYLNGARVQLLQHSQDTSFATADTSDTRHWLPDGDGLQTDSLAFGTDFTTREVMLLDRGKAYSPVGKRMVKFRLRQVTTTAYTIEWQWYDSTRINIAYIPKDTSYSLMYYSFDSKTLVYPAPKSKEWDICFTRYTTTFESEPWNTPYRNYAVVGGILNIWKGVKGQEVRKGKESISFKDFSVADAMYALQLGMSTRADIPGYDWKYYDFNANKYMIRTDQYYFVQCADGIIYKVRVLDFYDTKGTKGTISFEQQKL
jgi:hypothetical protein